MHRKLACITPCIPWANVPPRPWHCQCTLMPSCRKNCALQYVAYPCIWQPHACNAFCIACHALAGSQVPVVTPPVCAHNIAIHVYKSTWCTIVHANTTMFYFYVPAAQKQTLHDHRRWLRLKQARQRGSASRLTRWPTDKTRAPWPSTWAPSSCGKDTGPHSFAAQRMHAVAKTPIPHPTHAHPSSPGWWPPTRPGGQKRPMRGPLPGGSARESG